MMHGIIKEKGKITGYKAHVYPVLNDGDHKNRKIARDRQQDELKRADLALEEWATWYLSRHGYNSASPIAKLSELPAQSEFRLPNGVDCSSETANVIYVFNVMRRGGIHAQLNLLQVFYLNRNKNQSLKNFLIILMIKIKELDLWRQ